MQPALPMPLNALWAGALSLLLRHDETACPKSGQQAADLLDRLADDPTLDRETRALCARASDRLGERCHDRPPSRDDGGMQKSACTGK